MESEAVQASIPEFSTTKKATGYIKQVIILISNICQEPMERKYQHITRDEERQCGGNSINQRIFQWILASELR